MTELDKWALTKLNKLLRKVSKAYEEYEFHVVFHSVHNFCTVDLSNIYFDVLKDKLYCSHPRDQERKAAQTVLWELIRVIVAILTPVLAFTTEEIWAHLRKPEECISVQLLEWPTVKDDYINEEIEAKIDRLLDVRIVVTKALEEARKQKVIGHSLGAWVTIFADAEHFKLLQSTAGLEKIFIVSRADVKPEAERSSDALALDEVQGIWVSVKSAEGEKCERCWIIEPSVGSNEAHPTLCQRCSEVVARLEQEGVK
jgi:isoleucyl-tRNA synthetase